MADNTFSDKTSNTLAGTVAVVMARVLVPLWLALGAVLKLVDLSPAHLPAALIQWFGGNGIDLMFVLRFSIAVELIVAGVMVLLPSLARWVGIAILPAFAPVLIGDIHHGASSCGCFGAIEFSPWITLVTDVSFLLGLIFLGRREPRLALTRNLPTSKVLAAGAWSLLSVAAAFGLSAPAPVGGGVSADAGSVDVPALPSDGYSMPQYQDWIGRRFEELDVAAWTSNLPDDIGFGLL